VTTVLLSDMRGSEQYQLMNSWMECGYPRWDFGGIVPEFRAERLKIIARTL